MPYPALDRRRLPAAAAAPGAQRLVALLLAIAAIAAMPQRAPAQATWEYSPYVIKVWVACEPSTVSDGLIDEIARTVCERAYLVAGATWDIQTVRCPEALRAEVLADIEAMTVDRVKAVGRGALAVTEKADADDAAKARSLGEIVLRDADKLFLLAVRDDRVQFTIAIRELDCRSRTWRPVLTRRVIQPDQVPHACFAAIVDAFSPVVRIEMCKGREAQVRIRAGGLITSDRSPTCVRDSDVLLPIIRRNDRHGEPREGGIQVVPWSFLTITGRRGNVLDCKLHSGMRSALGGRSSSRTVKLALVVKPRGSSTLLHLESREEDPVPLAGYEIHAKDPETDESELIGKTDWRGVLAVPQAKHLLRILYVRNGGRLLARLPMVPGLETELTVQVSNDDQRLKAEGFVKGLQTKVMDLVARRELYTARFRRYLKQGDLDKAAAVLEDFRNLETRSDLSRQLLQEEQRLTSPDRVVQAKIDQLFTDTRQLLQRFLDPGRANQLARDLADAQSRSRARGAAKRKSAGS